MADVAISQILRQPGFEWDGMEFADVLVACKFQPD